jgi:polyhydroxybutyrate depolymerase
MMRALVPAAAALAAVTIACGDNGSNPTDASQTVSASTASPGACTPSRLQEPGDALETLRVGGVERSYLVHVPAAYEGTSPIPLMLGFPASEMTPEAFAGLTGLSDASDGYGFLMVTLSAAGDPAHWNSLANGGEVDDLVFATAVMDAVASAYCIDESRVYVAGYSGGGGMAQALACDDPERIAGIAVVASTFLSCRANVPMVAFHGMEDPFVPFEGGTLAPPAGQSQVFPSVRRAASEWARAVGCDGLASISRPASEVELSTYKRCFHGDGEVLLYAIVGGGHTWPGSVANIEQLGFTTQQLDATQVIWDFFTEHSKVR